MWRPILMTVVLFGSSTGCGTIDSSGDYVYWSASISDQEHRQIRGRLTANNDRIELILLNNGDSAECINRSSVFSLYGAIAMSPEFDVVETHVRNMLFSGDAEVIRIAPNERFMRSYSIDELFSINDSAYWQVISVHNFFPSRSLLFEINPEAALNIF